VSGEPGTRLVLLHQWHVGLYVRANLDDATARTDQQQVERTHCLWASNSTSCRPSVVATVATVHCVRRVPGLARRPAFGSRWRADRLNATAIDACLYVAGPDSDREPDGDQCSAADQPVDRCLADPERPGGLRHPDPLLLVLRHGSECTDRAASCLVGRGAGPPTNPSAERGAAGRLREPMAAYASSGRS